VILVDVNILIHAVDRDSPRHTAARAWWEEQLSATRPVGLPWAVILGFVRITTNPRILGRPLALDEALQVVESWFAQPCVRPLDPTARHWELLAALLRQAGTAGNLTTDAHLAALALEHGAELCSTDTDFARFPDLKWHNPLTASK